jgi:exopolysaccharide production protein ExoZ
VIASLMIVLFHAHSIALKQATAGGEAFFQAPVWWYSCIELFFTMSGFLMIHMSRNLYGSAKGVKNFAVRRAVRTPPLYWVYTLLITGIFLVQPSLSAEGPIDLRTFLASIFFYPDARSPVIAIGWTLNYEIFFYTIIGLSIFLPFAHGWKMAVAILITLVTIGRVFELNTNPWATWTDPLLLDFVIGIIVAVIYYQGISLSKLGAVLCVGIGFFLIGSYESIQNFDVTRAATMGVGMGLILAAATWQEKPLVLGKYAPLVTLLSQQTYTMYLCHILVLKGVQLVYFPVLTYFGFAGFGVNIGYIAVGTLATLVISRILYFIIEKPLTEYLRQQLHKSKQRPPTTATA